MPRAAEAVIGASVLEALAAIPLGRIAEPREVAAAIAFLAMDAASYVTGRSTAGSIQGLPAA